MKIAISGKRNSGKDTVANFLTEELGKDATYRTAFAEPIKKIVQILYPDISYDVLWGPSHLRDSTIIPNLTDNGKPLTVRKLIQDIGKFGRKYNPDIWANTTIQTCYNYLASGAHAVISDCRFINELNKLKHNKFLIIRINRNIIRDSGTDLDISETDLDELNDSAYDYIINNDSDLVTLQENISRMLKTLSNA